MKEINRKDYATENEYYGAVFARDMQHLSDCWDAKILNVYESR